MTIIRKHFDSAAALLEYSQRRPVDKRGSYALSIWEERDQPDGGHQGAEWFGMRRGERPASVMARLFAEGWPQGVARINEALASIQDSVPRPQSIRRSMTWTDHGDVLDIHRVNSGRLDVAWQRPMRRKVSARATVTLAPDSSLASKRSVDILFWRGAAVVHLCNLLTEAGYNVEIVMARNVDLTCDGGKGDKLYQHTVTIKSALAPLDIHALAALAAHPASTRAIAHRATCVAASEARVRVTDGLAKPLDPRELLPDALVAGDDCCNREQAIDWVRAGIAIVEGRMAG